MTETHLTQPGIPDRPPSDWTSRQAALQAMAERQLFFVGGAPRSGTTWLQSLLDAHPDISCRGEGLFPQELAAPLDALFARRREVIVAKNARVFAHGAGYPVPDQDHADHLLATGILLALQQQCGARQVRAVGEKTPENVFAFPRLLRLFPRAKFLVIARDPRDVLASAWHFFRNEPGSGEAEKWAFLQAALPSIAEGARMAIAFATAHPEATLSPTYEGLLADPQGWGARLFAFLGVDADPAKVAACIEAASFRSMSGEAMRRGQGSGNGSFFRAGRAGGWQDTFDARMGALIQRELDWMFDHYGWLR